MQNSPALNQPQYSLTEQFQFKVKHQVFSGQSRPVTCLGPHNTHNCMGPQKSIYDTEKETMCKRMMQSNSHKKTLTSGLKSH